MLVVKVELHSAITGEITTIAKAIIHNIGGTHHRGNYESLVLRKNSVNKPHRKLERDRDVLRIGEVHDYPRLNYNVWRLVIRALRDCFKEEK